MNKLVNVCLIGSGRAGMIHGHNYISGVPNANIVAVCDPVGDVARDAAKELGIDTYYKDYKDVMADDDIDAVIIACPTKFHKDIAVAAANAKKHIFCEKPMAMNEDECEEMIQAAEKNQVKLQIGFMRRFDESFREAKRIIEAGEIGEVVSVKSHTRGPSKPREWMYDVSISNGPLGEVCSHDIDTVRWFSGSEISSMYAIGGNYRNKEIQDKYPDFYDNVIMNVKFANGMQGVVEGAQYVQYGYDARVEILGTQGVISLGDIHEKKVLTCTKNHEMKRPTMHSWTYLFKDAYVAEDISFVNSIINDTPVEASGYDGKMAVKIVKLGNESLRNNKIVNVED
ncbi:MAG: Gfo/Idh/MocA family oxidoreductase [Anaerostipes sp.]|nr:Gfo/Idh/MocA family oxidoreductase [Anaerostipes sp.]